MKKINIFLIVLAVLVISCKNKTAELNVESPEKNDVSSETIEETEINISEINTNKIIEQLQGKWKENEYPYRAIEFKESTAKYTEEGISEQLKFKKFEILDKCLFNANNIKNLNSGDIILSLPEAERCEKLEITHDTLILSGFSTNTKKDYHIVYLKEK